VGWTLGYRLLYKALIVALCVFIVAPLVAVVYVSLSPVSYFVFPPRGLSLQWYARILEHPVFLTSFVRSLSVGVLVVVVCAVLCIPAALVLHRHDFRGKGAVEFLMLSPLVFPTLIFALAILYFFHRIGLHDTFFGLVVSHTIVSMPYFLRSVFVSVHALDPSLEEASEVLGATPWQTFRNVTLPRLLPGILAGSIFAFIVAFDQFTVALFVSGAEQVTLPIAIYNYLYHSSDPTVAAISTFLIVFGFVASVLINRYVGLERVFGGRTSS